MDKLDLNDVANIFTAATTLNGNNTKIEVAMENTLSRDGTSPNEMNSSIDMNDHRVYNLPDATDGGDAVAFRQISPVLTALEDIEESVELAQDAAATSQSAVVQITNLYDEILGQDPEGLDIIDGGFYPPEGWEPGDNADGGSY